MQTNIKAKGMCYNVLGETQSFPFLLQVMLQLWNWETYQRLDLFWSRTFVKRALSLSHSPKTTSRCLDSSKCTMWVFYPSLAIKFCHQSHIGLLLRNPKWGRNEKYIEIYFQFVYWMSYSLFLLPNLISSRLKAFLLKSLQSSATLLHVVNGCMYFHHINGLPSLLCDEWKWETFTGVTDIPSYWEIHLISRIKILPLLSEIQHEHQQHSAPWSCLINTEYKGRDTAKSWDRHWKASLKPRLNLSSSFDFGINGKIFMRDEYLQAETLKADSFVALKGRERRVERWGWG